jgi:protein transport protein SEC24
MVVLTDPLDPELPIPDDLIVNLEESKVLIFALLDQLPAMFEHPATYNNTSSCFSVAIDVAYKIFKPVGGRMLIF